MNFALESHWGEKKDILASENIWKEKPKTLIFHDEIII